MSRKIDFGGRDWAAHAQDHWLEFAGHPHFPDYLRVVFVAYGRHKANGHAKLNRGDLTRYLVRKDGTLPERRTVSRAVDKAVQLGYLLEGSRMLCLIVSSDHVQGGKGQPEDRCSRDHTSRKQPNVGNDCGRFGSNVRSDSGRSGVNVGNGCGRSEPEPSLSSTTGPAGPEHPQTQGARA
ncbi:hypothetical protein KUV85_06825 [Nocardioides panacisoli]|uniref:hypothetical protein n=1 Tax=Nocardioides panacisoli TaxID=627624 RepID=UPI001C636828|nr:hypothetical protein [Nocardioides panacisoli]QYJ05387.1 hypothetical protein KUV85_06825 [Nocardioides panacisoli]